MLTEASAAGPYCVSLLDEIEKGPPRTCSTILAGLGRWPAEPTTEGHTVRFHQHDRRNDSNIGSQVIQRIGKEGAARSRMREAG